MAGMGPPPKPTRLRQRRNKVSTRATLEVSPSPQEPAESAADQPPAAGSAPLAVKVRPLPDRPCRGYDAGGCLKTEACLICRGTLLVPWHPRTVEWWSEVWRSPSAGEYIETDIVGGLYLLAGLYDAWWGTGELEYAKEIRMQESRFGLDVMARRRLQWELKRPADRRPAVAAPTTPDAPPRPDPRKLLTMVKPA